MIKTLNKKQFSTMIVKNLCFFVYMLHNKLLLQHTIFLQSKNNSFYTKQSADKTKQFFIILKNVWVRNISVHSEKKLKESLRDFMKLWSISLWNNIRIQCKLLISVSLRKLFIFWIIESQGYSFSGKCDCLV